MRAKDMMTIRTVTVGPQTTVVEIVKALVGHRISAVPVVDEQGATLGIVSEGDLLRRVELVEAVGTSLGWRRLFRSTENLARDYLKAHGWLAEDIMTKPALTVDEDTPLSEVAALLIRKRVKRLPVTRDGKLAGIVSRADLMRALVQTHGELATPVTADDRAIERCLAASLKREAWYSPGETNIMVVDGVAQLWGIVRSEAERRAFKIAVEATAGVRSVEDHLQPESETGHYGVV